MTAAHCTEYIQQRNPVHDVEEFNLECVEDTIKHGTYTSKTDSDSFELKCAFIDHKLKSGNVIKHLEIHPVNPKGMVWLGLLDIHEIEKNDDYEASTIKRVIRHAHSYRGGATYGDYGGYDISIIELDTPITKFQLACLPNPKFDDSNQNIGYTVAGYGKYQRNYCLTNKFGKAKYHYCIYDSDCNTESSPPQDKICDKLMKSSEGKSLDKDEAMIVGSDEKVHFCFKQFNPENRAFGWCPTEGYFYDLSQQNKSAKSWGYCSKDCFLEKSDFESGVLRIKNNVMVLSEKRCNHYLNWTLFVKEGSLSEGKTVKYMPKILCVGQVGEWSIDVYQQNGKKFQKKSSKQAHHDINQHHYGAKYESEYAGYVYSSGTCKGDSGGPIYQTEQDESKKPIYVVTGK